MTAKENELRKRIEALMEWNGINQPQLAEKIGVNQSLVSRWLSGSAMPSVEGFIRLGALAAESDPDGARFYWSQTGLDADLLLSVAEAMLRGGLGRQLLATADAILKARIVDPKGLEEEGKIVLVPPYTEGEWKDQGSLAPLPMAAEVVRSAASTFYIYVEPNGGMAPAGRGFSPKDRIVFDAYGASSRKLAPLIGHMVLANVGAPFVPRGRETSEQRMTGMRLHLGRLELKESGPVRTLVLRTPAAENALSFFTLLPLVHANHREQIDRGTRFAEYPNVIDATEHDAIAALTAPQSCEILGRFVALISGGSTGKDEITAAQLKRYRGDL